MGWVPPDVPASPDAKPPSASPRPLPKAREAAARVQPRPASARFAGDDIVGPLDAQVCAGRPKTQIISPMRLSFATIAPVRNLAFARLTTHAIDILATIATVKLSLPFPNGPRCRMSSTHMCAGPMCLRYMSDSLLAFSNRDFVFCAPHRRPRSPSSTAFAPDTRTLHR